MAKAKFCRDCLWSEKGHSQLVCLTPKDIVIRGYNLTTGKLDTRYDYHFCGDRRSDRGECGPEGKLFARGFWYWLKYPFLPKAGPREH